MTTDIGQRSRKIDAAEDGPRRPPPRVAELRSAALDALDDGFAVVSMVFGPGGEPFDYVFVDMNAAFERHTGLTGAVGNRAYEIAPGLDPFWAQFYGRVATRCEAARTQHGFAPLGRWFEVHAFPIPGDGETLVGIHFSDITKQRRLEIQTREAEIRYRSALRVGRIGAWETDFARGLRIWSEEGLALFGIELPGGIGQAGGPDDEWRASLHPEEGHLPEVIQAHLQTEDRLQVRYRIVRPDGHVLSLLGHAEVAARDEDGRIVRLVDVVADITDLAQAEQALRTSEARFRAIQDTTIDGFMVLESERGPDGRIVDFRWLYANDAVERIVGKPASWFNGRRLLEEMPDNKTSGRFDAYVAVVESGLPWSQEFAYSLEGRDLFLRATCAKANDGFAVTFADLTDRRRAEERVRESEARLAFALAAGQLGVHDYDPRSGEIKWDATVRALWGVPEPEPVNYAVFAAGVHSADLPGVEAQLAAALEPGSQGHFAMEYRVINRVTGEIRWVVANGDVTFEDGVATRTVGTVRDISAAKQAEADRQLLLEELNNRVKNTLATVKAIATQTLRGEGVSEAARTAFDGRLMALAAAHDALIEQHWTSASLVEVVGKALAPHVSRAGDRLNVEGDDTRLNAHSALALTMCLHELATNAAKYGALSNDAGHVRISWSAADDRLVLRWEEHGGPPVQPPTTRGFGSKLLERVIAGDLRGESQMIFAPEGLICVISAQLGD